MAIYYAICYETMRNHVIKDKKPGHGYLLALINPVLAHASGTCHSITVLLHPAHLAYSYVNMMHDVIKWKLKPLEYHGCGLLVYQCFEHLLGS